MLKSKFASKPYGNHLGFKCKPTSVKNQQANTVQEQVHQVITTMLPTAELDMANTVETSNIDVFLTKCNIGHLLNLTHRTKSLPKQSNN